MWTIEEGIERLRERGAKVTAQRIAMLRQLEKRCDHPSAEVLYRELKQDYPTLSIATIYNTAQLFSETQLLKVISIDDKRVYFDPDLTEHGHFLCRHCGKLLDIPIAARLVSEVTDPIKEISSVEQTDIFIYGSCVDCCNQRALPYN